jgi:hypothetical protein
MGPQGANFRTREADAIERTRGARGQLLLPMQARVLSRETCGMLTGNLMEILPFIPWVLIIVVAFLYVRSKSSGRNLSNATLPALWILFIVLPFVSQGAAVIIFGPGPYSTTGMERALVEELNMSPENAGHVEDSALRIIGALIGALVADVVSLLFVKPIRRRSTAASADPSVKTVVGAGSGGDALNRAEVPPRTSQMPDSEPRP